MNIFKNSNQMRKICNLIVAFLGVFSIFLISVMFTTINSEHISADNSYNQAVADAKRYNSVIPKPDITTIEESRYESGIDAVLDAWNNYNNATSFTITGTTNTTASPSLPVGDYIIFSSMRSAKWEDGGMFHEVHKYQKQGSTTFVDMNEATQAYSFNGVRYDRGTKTGISLKGSYVTATYTGGYAVNPEYAPVTPICYDISLQTINACTNFSVTRINGKIKYYNVDLKLNPVTSVYDYARVIEKAGELDETPRFNSVTMKMTIDRDGNIVTLRVIEDYVIKKTIEIPTINDITFNISNYGEVPTIERPQV